MKALGIDFGTARIGVALSDDLGMLAHPLETVPGQNLDAAAVRIGELVVERKVETVVIGLPLHMNGDEGEAVKKVRKFVELMKPEFPESVEIVEVDERLSTVNAMEKLHAAGRNAKNSKGIIDMAAAVEILQQWLDSQADGEIPPPRWDEVEPDFDN